MDIEDRVLPDTNNEEVAYKLLPEKEEAEEMTKWKLNSDLDNTLDRNIEDKEPKKKIQSSEDHQPFLYELNDTLIIFLCYNS